MAKPDGENKTSELSGNLNDRLDKFFDGFGIPSKKFEKNKQKRYTYPLVDPQEGSNEGELTETDIRKKLNDLIDSTDESLLEAAFKAVQSVVGEATPSVAPMLWKDRDRSKKMKCTDFVLDVYKPWIGKGLRRHHLKKIDTQLYQTLGAFFARNGVPKRLESLENADEKITLEFLEERGIAEPKDALRVFKDDPREAQRVYAAALRKLNK